MTSSKEIQQTSRPMGQNRLSMSTHSGSLPKSHARTHSSSASTGSLITSNRVSRRKSVSSNATSNIAAMAALARETGDMTLGIPITSRRNTMSKGASARGMALGSLPSPPASLPLHRVRMMSGGKSDLGESAIEDDQNEDIEEEDDENEFKQARNRRASEGQHLIKDGKKANASDLKCDKCGKGYKHSSCLSKHLWEHDPAWSYTSKLLISKHQQVQLLEAASVLISFGKGSEKGDGTDATPPDSAKDFQSDQESASPAASGSSEHRDGISSADTTPPPQADIFNTYGSGSYISRHKRYSSGQGFSRSYQSAPSAVLLNGSSMPIASGFGHRRQPSHERRPFSSGFGRSNEDEKLADAAEALSSGFGSLGTSRAIPVNLPEDTPPVPNIPARYLSQKMFPTANLSPGQRPGQTMSYTRSPNRLDEDVKMEESEESVADDEDYDRRSRGRSDEDDEDGVFGRMEE